jgi:hypothetical protein
MASNEVFHKPVLYKVLDFAYAFFLFPFYIFKNIRIQFASYFSDKALVPVYGFFPVFPYIEKPDKEPTVFERFFGYPDAEDVRQAVMKKVNEEKEKAEDLVKTFPITLQKLKEAKVEERKQA